jgi:type III pantothenate kinase
VLDGPYDGAVLASVVPAVGDRFRDAASRTGAELLEVTPELGQFVARIKGLYASMGADRVADVIAMAASLTLPALCIDAGTAVTFDLLGEGRVWSGGLILPGPALLARSMAQETALLPQVQVESEDLMLATGTVPAISTGARWGGIAMVDGLLRLLTAHGYEWRSLVLTGGGASSLSPHLSFDHVVDGDLGFRGMSIVWEAAGARTDTR